MDTTQPYGLVHGRIYQASGDSADTGRTPDLSGLSGTATFTATVDRLIVTTPGAQQVVVPGAINADIINGALQWAGEDDVPLIANLDAAGKSLGWQWQVAFSNLKNAQDQQVTIVGWKLDVKIYDPNAALVNGDNPTVTQLTDQAPVTSLSAPVIAKGDQGVKGDPGLTFQGAWQSGTAYAARDAVSYQGSSYVALVGSTNDQPPSANWALLAAKGDAGSGAGTVQKVAGIAPDGSGNVALTPGNIGAADTASVTAAQSAADSASTEAASKYTKPAGGIPSTDLDTGTQTTLGKADSAYQKPGTGIPSADLDTGVQASLTAAGTAYQKPGTGIPETDLDAAVQSTLTNSVPNTRKVNGRALSADITTASSDITDATTVGKSLLTAADAPSARVVMGAWNVLVLGPSDPLPTNPGANTLVVRTS